MNIEEKLVTIGVCVYNGEEFLKGALESALAQTHENLEILIFNDGSTDATLSIIESVIKSVSDPRISVLDSTRNYGVGYARQIVKTVARGEYLTWLDADDLYHKDRIKTLLTYAVIHNSDITCDIYRFMNHQGELLDSTYRVPDKVASDKYFTRLFERNKMIPHPLISKRCYKSINFNPDAMVSEDYDFWLKSSYAGYTYARVEEVKLNYRKTNNSLSSNYERNRIFTKKVLETYSVPDLIYLYQSRGFSEEITHYMACLQFIFRQDYESALPWAMKRWPLEDDEIDQEFYLGTLFLRNGQFFQAQVHLENHLLKKPDSPGGYNNMGIVLRYQGEDGAPFFHKALSLMPGYLDAAMNLENPLKEAITDTQI